MPFRPAKPVNQSGAAMIALRIADPTNPYSNLTIHQNRRTVCKTTGVKVLIL